MGRWPALLMMATLAIMLFDVLGVLFAAVLTGYCFILYWFKPDKYKAAILIGLVLGMIVWVIYFRWLGPDIMLAVTGQYADSYYLSQAPFQNLVPFIIGKMPLLFLDMVRTLLGNITQLQAFIVFVMLGGVAIWLGTGSKESLAGESLPCNHNITINEEKEYSEARKKDWAAQIEPFFSLLALISSILVVYDFLVVRHPPILMPDIRLAYYIMPAQAVLLFGITALLVQPRLQKKIFSDHIYPVIILLLLFLVVGNVNGVIEIKDVLEGGHLSEFYQYTPRLLDALRHLHTPNYVPDKTIITDPIYQFFLK
jgi:hypothetical protein